MIIKLNDIELKVIELEVKYRKPEVTYESGMPRWDKLLGNMKPIGAGEIEEISMECELYDNYYELMSNPAQLYKLTIVTSENKTVRLDCNLVSLSASQKTFIIKLQIM